MPTSRFKQESLGKVSFIYYLRNIVTKIIIVLNTLPIQGLTCFEFICILDKIKIFSEMKILQCIQNGVVVKFKDVELCIML